MNIDRIKTEDEYEVALSRLNDIFDAEPGTPEGEDLEILLDLIVAYEEFRWPMVQ